MGLLYRLKNQPSSAQDFFEKALSLKPNYMDAFVNLISLLIDRKEIDSAVKKCNAQIQVLKGDPESMAVVYNLKGKLFMLSNDFQAAERLFREAMIQNPNYLPPYYSLAQLYLEQDKTGKAIAQYQMALERDPDQVIPHMMLGVLYCMQNRCGAAVPHYVKALKINPNFVPAANNLAYIWAEQGEHLSEALRLAQKAKNFLPDDPRVADTLGWVYFKLGLYDDAIREFSESIEKLPDNATVQFHLGMTYYKKGDRNRAKLALKRALHLDEHFQEADQAKRILSAIES